MSERAQQLADLLSEKLEASHVEVVDESQLHAGHAGAQEGKGHFRAVIVSEHFQGLSRVAAQRLVFEALSDQMRDEIHAFAMTTYTPQAWDRHSRSR